MSSSIRDNNSTNDGGNNDLPISVSRSNDTNETNNATSNDESAPPAVELPVAANDLQLPGMGTIERGEAAEFNDDYDGAGDTSIVLRGSGNSNGGIRTSSRGKVIFVINTMV